MIATALALNLKRNKSVSAIDSFISTITYDNTREKLIPQQSSIIEKMNKEIAKELLECNDDIIVLSKEQIIIHETISSILKNEVKTNPVSVFLKKLKIIETLIIFSLFLGIIGSIISVFKRNVIDMYFFCFLIWILSCVALWITLRLIIKDWKNNQYGKKNKN